MVKDGGMDIAANGLMQGCSALRIGSAVGNNMVARGELVGIIKYIRAGAARGVNTSRRIW